MVSETRISKKFVVELVVSMCIDNGIDYIHFTNYGCLDRENTMSDFEIQDDFLSKQQYQELTSLHIEYAKVHWIGLHAESQNILHTLVQSIRPKQDVTVLGATAWYNIRPTMPVAHNDIYSYCTYEGKSYIPDILPKKTYLYYVKSPDKGGNLQLETGEEVEPKVNRLVSFPIEITHKVLPYEGNRVSIGMIFWPQLPSFYGRVTNTETKIFDRVWEIEDARV